MFYLGKSLFYSMSGVCQFQKGANWHPVDVASAGVMIRHNF